MDRQFDGEKLGCRLQPEPSSQTIVAGREDGSGWSLHPSITTSNWLSIAYTARPARGGRRCNRCRLLQRLPEESFSRSQSGDTLRRVERSNHSARCACCGSTRRFRHKAFDSAVKKEQEEAGPQ